MFDKSIIGVVRIPACGILCLSTEWRNAFGYPEPTKSDWKSIAGLRNSLSVACICNDGKMLRSSSYQEEMLYGQGDIVVETGISMKKIRSLSFYDFLHERMISEARQYSDCGISNFILDFGDLCDEPAVYWMARCLSEEFKNASSEEFSIGITMRNGKWASDIACRTGFDFVLCKEDAVRIAEERNRMTDGTEKKKVRIFTVVSGNDTVSEFLEGIVVKGNDENELDGVWRSVNRMRDAYCIDIPMVCFYSDEMIRDGFCHEMDGFCHADALIVDESIRIKGDSNLCIDNECLEKTCERIENFNG